MPELPEVETTRRGIAEHLVNHTITDVVIRNGNLRWPIPQDLRQKLVGTAVTELSRRAKYLLAHTEHGTLILHLGMSGSLRVVRDSDPPEPHDHFDLVLASGNRLRLRDPRRFGAVLWTSKPVEQHHLLRNLGPEPLDEGFDGELLYRLSRGRRAPVKTFLMDNHVVVGVGNIYANEALFAAGIHPTRPAGRISLARYQRLAEEVRTVLAAAIEKGGTTLRDFVSATGQPGYFRLDLRVYDRAGKECKVCGSTIHSRTIGQRNSFYCQQCQH